MWEKIKKLTDIALIAGFLGFIYCVLVMTYTGAEQIKIYIKDAKLNSISFTKISKEFEKKLQENIFEKHNFINLNGRAIKTLKINSLNGVQKMKNGYLTWQGGVRGESELAENVIELNDFLLERDIPFIYILVPRKNSMYDAEPSPGYVYESRKSMNNMVNILNNTGVNNINMDAWFKKNGWHTKDAFFKTDHHWKPEAALAAARCTMEVLQQRNIVEYDEDKLQDKSYKIQVLKNWLLGSQGKRVGKYYAGTDDISIYYPKFKTEYYYSRLKTGTTDWSFYDNILDLNYIKKIDYYESSPYDIYMYGDYQLRTTINNKGHNDKRLLIFGDSFKMVLEYFLTTQFKEIHTIDIRRYKDNTLAQYIEEVKPDVVIMCTNVGDFSRKENYIFGIKEYLEARKEPLGSIQELGDFNVQAEEKNNNKFEVVCSNLEPNQTYTLTIDRTELSGVKDSFIQMTLQNMSENKAVYNRYFNANSDKRQKWIFTTPEKVEDTYGIYLYAGAKGHTAKIRVKVEGIKLQKGIYEG